MPTYFYHPTCPLCLDNIDESNPDLYRVLPLDHALEWAARKKPLWSSVNGVVRVETLTFSSRELDYTQRSCLFHKDCLVRIYYLPSPMLSSLLDMIEPTFLERSLRPVSQQGAFFTPEGSSTHSHAEASNQEQLLLSFISSRLPWEVWEMILRYDIDRLLFLMRAAWQIRTSSMRPVHIPEQRFTMTRIIILGQALRIHLIDIGGKTYISRLSDATVYPPGSLPSMRHRTDPSKPIMSTELFEKVNRQFNIRHKDYSLNGRTYLAVKSDGIGIVDVAFQRSNGTPDWIFNARVRACTQEISEIRYANLRDLLVISDSVKCRGLIPCNRTGAEPFFCGKYTPPEEGWVDSGFVADECKSMISHPKPYMDPMAYIAKAEYIALHDMTSISIVMDDTLSEISSIESNTVRPSDEGSDEGRGVYSARFTKPPKSIRFVIFAYDKYHLYKIPLIQFEVDGRWEPEFPRESRVLRQVRVDNVLGIWWAKNVLFSSSHYGVVVSKQNNLVNTQPF